MNQEKTKNVTEENFFSRTKNQVQVSKPKTYKKKLNFPESSGGSSYEQSETDQDRENTPETTVTELRNDETLKSAQKQLDQVRQTISLFDPKSIRNLEELLLNDDYETGDVEPLRPTLPTSSDEPPKTTTPVREVPESFVKIHAFLEAAQKIYISIYGGYTRTCEALITGFQKMSTTQIQTKLLQAHLRLLSGRESILLTPYFAGETPCSSNWTNPISKQFQELSEQFDIPRFQEHFSNWTNSRRFKLLQESTTDVTHCVRALQFTNFKLLQSKWEEFHREFRSLISTDVMNFLQRMNSAVVQFDRGLETLRTRFQNLSSDDGIDVAKILKKNRPPPQLQEVFPQLQEVDRIDNKALTRVFDALPYLVPDMIHAKPGFSPEEGKTEPKILAEYLRQAGHSQVAKTWDWDSQLLQVSTVFLKESFKRYKNVIQSISGETTAFLEKFQRRFNDLYNTTQLEMKRISESQRNLASLAPDTAEETETSFSGTFFFTFSQQLEKDQRIFQELFQKCDNVASDDTLNAQARLSK